MIKCSTFAGQAVSGQTTLRVLQGAEISWVIRPSTDDKVIVETAQPGHFEKAVTEIWDVALAAKQSQ